MLLFLKNVFIKLKIFILLRTICFRGNKLISVDETFVSVGTK